VSIVFADLRNFTSWSEERSPEVVVAMLNHLWAMVLAEAAEFGGTVNQFMGDGVMMLFNAPEEQPRHAHQALECARRLAALTPADEALRFGVGVNSGFVVAGNIGGLERLSYTAIGTATNVAHRLQSMAKPGQVVFGPRTHALADDVPARSLGFISLRGFRTPIEVFELLPPKP
jgi:class 3 adenylate cyclase